MSAKFFLTGFMGSGKTYWGKLWAENNSLQFYDLDKEIEKNSGKSVAEIFEKNGEDYFREIEKDELKKFAEKENFILACGGGTACFFDNIQWMNRQGVTIFLQASSNEIFQRIITETAERPLLNKLDTSGLHLFINQKLKEREPFYMQAKHIFNTTELTINSLGDLIDRKVEDLNSNNVSSKKDK